jgi:hypothetical protein
MTHFRKNGNSYLLKDSSEVNRVWG